VSSDFNRSYLWGIRREGAFDAFTLNDTTHSEHFPSSVAAAGNNHTAELLDTFFVAFQNSGVHVDSVADGELQRLFAQAGFLGDIQKLITHDQGPFDSKRSTITSTNTS
jgi:hypothetical protein